ncbi:Oligopeptide transporter [Lachnellula subtilissima]|uniref:Oligopeptide transporter n=1 Tax=Lachnellula subtilissima TaxID=602034 RepID=A0A8H8RCR6_9HELO|nr:Oligopeptide transporter [Lachnellula subtilissima]
MPDYLDGRRRSGIYSDDSSKASSTTKLGSTSDVSETTAVEDDDASSHRLSTPDRKTSSNLPSYSSDEKSPEYFTEEQGEKRADGHLPDDDPALRDIPLHVRRVVSLEDDPSTPVITFRYFILTVLFIAPGAFLSQLNEFRTTYAPYSIFFVQIASNYAGEWLARVLPAWEVKIPFTKKSFNLNPGPFSTKEHVLVTISCASGATYNLAWVPISLSELYFGNPIHPAVCLFFMLAVVWIGYSYAALARQFLIYDPQYPWYQALCQTALFETQKKQRESPSPVSRRQMLIFFLTLIGVMIWQFLPEFVFPFLQSLALLCWIAPRNATANFVGGGLGGMGLLNISLDWSNVGNSNLVGSLFLTPWWTQVIVFMAFAVNCWVLLPLAKWGGLGSWNHHLMSNRLFTANGTSYPIRDLISPDMSLDEVAYAAHGPPYVGTQLLWALFFDYASYTSAIVWMALFGYPLLKSSIQRWRERRSGEKKPSVNHQYNDQLNILMRSYSEVPVSWYLVLFIASFTIIITLLANGYMFIPLWTCFVAMMTGAIVVVPLGWLYSISNFQLAIGSTNEVIYGLMVNCVSGHKNPVGASVYGTIAGDAWYRAQVMLQDQKLGHYMHIPPRAVFFSQIFGSLIGVPINYGVIRWVLNTKSGFLSGAEIDPTHQWTGQKLAQYLTIGVQYVLVGPKRLFALELYRPLPYGFLAGALAPFVLYILHRCFPRAKFSLWNSTIFFSMMSTFWGNVSTGYTSSLIGGFVVMYWAYRRHYEVWARYNYILAAAFDAGYNFNMLINFLCFGAGKIITMPYWWGNNATSVERCFALNDD